jgi:hypothetical protein
VLLCRNILIHADLDLFIRIEKFSGRKNKNYFLNQFEGIKYVLKNNFAMVCPWKIEVDNKRDVLTLIETGWNP